MNKKFIKGLYESFKKNYFLSEDIQKEVFNKNIKNSVVVFAFLTFSGIIIFMITDEFKPFGLFYYLSLFIIGISGLIWSLLTKFIKSIKNNKRSQLFIYFFFIFLFFICFLSLKKDFVSDRAGVVFSIENKISDFVLLFFITYLMTFLFNANPILITFFYVVFIYFSVSSLWGNVDSNIILNILTICISGCIFSFWKRRLLIRDKRQEMMLERQNEELAVYKSSLEKEIQKKTKELVTQAERLLYVQENTIFGLSNIVESRDECTGNHVKRTSIYVELLAREAKKMGIYSDILSDAYINYLIKAAPLHDIGKISVSDTVLKNPNKLTKEEIEQIKIHSKEGARLIDEILGPVEEPEYVQIAHDVALYHHEKFDGSGYPMHLKGDSIPLCARIMAIADVFDALVTKRCYKEAFSVEEALSIINEGNGKHFDGKLVPVFISLKFQLEDVVISF